MSQIALRGTQKRTLSADAVEDVVMWVHGNHLVLLPKMVADAEQAKLGRRR